MADLGDFYNVAPSGAGTGPTMPSQAPQMASIGGNVHVTADHLTIVGVLAIFGLALILLHVE